MPKEITSVRKYAAQVFQDSLITGVPQILLTGNIGRKILKSIVLICCIIGFVYQTTEFLRIFWNYPTVLDIDVKYPDTIESPAVTFCNNNGIKKSLFCGSYPNRCKPPNSLNDFCNTFHEICNNNDRRNIKYPEVEAWQLENGKDRRYLKEMGHTGNETLPHCLMTASDEYRIDCKKSRAIHLMMEDGSNHYKNCYTLFSNINSTKLNQHMLPVFKSREPMFHFVFDVQPEEYFRPDREVGVTLSLHSADTLLNPFFDGFVIHPGHLYTVHLKMVEEKLLPSPYETKCKDYKSMWVMRGGKGPLNQDMCLAECVYNVSLDQCGCVIQDLVFYHDQKVCNEAEINLDDCLNYNISECYARCPQACEFIKFEYDVQKRKLEVNAVFELEQLYSRSAVTNSKAVVQVFLKRPEVIIYSHRPQYEDIEVFSFMGGYVGMWLGISLVAVFDFLENVFLVICFWIKKFKIRALLSINFF